MQHKNTSIITTNCLHGNVVIDLGEILMPHYNFFFKKGNVKNLMFCRKIFILHTFIIKNLKNCI